MGTIAACTSGKRLWKTPPTIIERLLPDIGSADQVAHAGEFRAHGHGQLLRRAANDLEAEFGQPAPVRLDPSGL